MRLLRQYKFLWVTFVAIAITCCVSYDQPLIYHKNFQPGTHPLLRFDGWYTSSAEYALYGRLKPVIFYRDGSVWFGEHLLYGSGTDTILQNEPHSWGNYKIDADTILVERFCKEQNASNYNRIIMKGIIQQDKIQWLQRTYHREKPDSVFYNIEFVERKWKPDSTENWTRTRPQYNK